MSWSGSFKYQFYANDNEAITNEQKPQVWLFRWWSQYMIGKAVFICRDSSLGVYLPLVGVGYRLYFISI